MKFLPLFIILNYFFSFFCFESEADSKSFDPKFAIWKIYNSIEGVQGTGFIVEKRYFVTTFHTIETMFTGAISREEEPLLRLLLSIAGESLKDKDIVLSQEGSTSILRLKRVVDLSYAYDLAIFEIEGEAEHSLKLRSSPLKYGELIFLLGYPHNQYVEMVPKLVSEDVLQYHFGIRRGVYTKRDNVQGASGAPLLDIDGRVIGVLSSSSTNDGTAIRAMTEHIYAVKVSYLKKLIENSHRRLHPLTAQLIVEDYIREKRDRLKNLADQGRPLYQYILAKKYTNDKDYLYWMRKAANNGFADAQYELAIYYKNQFIDEGDEKDLNRSFYWMRKAARSGHLVLAQYELAQMYSEEGDKQNFERSFYWMKQAAENKRNYPRAKYLLAAKYDEGEGIEPNPKRSFYWMKQAAGYGLAEAQYELAVKYEKGDGVRKNLERSFYWMQLAAEQGLREAEYELAVKYEKGDGVKKNFERSFYWMKRAADKSSQEALYGLAIKYSKGEGTEQNLELALEYFEKGEVGKHEYNFYKVQLRIVNRSFEDKSFVEGLKVLFLFAEKGNVLARYKLAHMYGKGKHVEKNLKQSFHWMKQAAEGGYVLAQYELAIKYEKGEGTERNPELAQRYFELAAKGGHPLAQRRCSGAF